MITAAEFDRLADRPADDPAGDTTPDLDLSKARRPDGLRIRWAIPDEPRDSVIWRVAELDQIQFLLGHVSIQTTERYLGCKQRLRCAVNDRLGIEPAG